MTINFEHLLSCDWGTTSFRLRLCALAPLRALASATSDDGVKAMVSRLGTEADAGARQRAFANHLRQAALDLLVPAGLSGRRIPVVGSGMASSSVGWRELPYAPLPFAVDGSGARVERLDLELEPGWTVPVLLVSGVAGDREMMRGEETQLIGLLALSRFTRYAADGVVVLPGTHSKHIRLHDGQVVAFQTFMTGELFQLLTQHSILRFTTTTGRTEVDEPAFAEGVRAVLERGLNRCLFQVRSRGVLGGISNELNRAYLCGLLVGDEVAALSREPDAVPILFAMNPPMSNHYLQAAQQVGIGDRCEAVNHAVLDQIVPEAHARLLPRFPELLQ